MGRKPHKTLDEQLELAKHDLSIAEEKAKGYKHIISEIESKIEEVSMKNIQSLLKVNNISIQELETMLHGRFGDSEDDEQK